MNVPIRLRGQVIGNLKLKRTDERHSWTEDELAMAQATAERVALAMENARLLDETSRRAERERTVTEITSKIRSTNNPAEMIDIALNELRNALGATQVQLIPQVISAPKNDKPAKISTPYQKAEKVHNGNGAKK
jgi:GAF domain-containing protein